MVTFMGLKTRWGSWSVRGNESMHWIFCLVFFFLTRKILLLFCQVGVWLLFQIPGPGNDQCESRGASFGDVSKFDVSIDELWQFRYMCKWLIEKNDSKIEVTSSPAKLHPVSFHKLWQQIDTYWVHREKQESRLRFILRSVQTVWSSKSFPNLELIFLSKDIMPHLG